MLEQNMFQENGNPSVPPMEPDDLKHQNPDNTEPDKRVELVHTFMNQTKRSGVRRKAEEWWVQADELYDGKHWKTNLAAHRAQLTINWVYPTVENYLAQLLDDLPDLMIMPRGSEDKDAAKAIDNFFKHEMDRNAWLSTIGMVFEKAIIRNIGFIKTYWDIHADGGRGAARLEGVSAYDLLLHPGARIRDGRLVTKYAIHGFKMTREEIIAKYGIDPKPSGNPQIDTLKRLQQSPRAPHGAQMMNDDLPIGKSFRLGSGSSGAKADVKNPLEQDTDMPDMIKIYECWYQDDTRVERENVDNVRLNAAPLIYPNGRVITVTDDMVLYDDMNRLGFLGFVAISPSPDPERLYSKSFVNHIADSQMEYNKRRSQIADHAAHLCNPQREVNLMAGIDTDSITGEPGALFINNGVTEGPAITNLEVPQLGPEVGESLILAREEIREISGVVRKPPTQVRSGIGIREERERDEARPSMKAMYTDAGLMQVARNVISMYLDFVPDERKYRFINSDAQLDFGEFNPIEMMFPKRETAIAQVQLEISQLEQHLAQAVATGADEQTLGVIQEYIQEAVQKIQTISTMPAHDLISYDIEIKPGSRGQAKAEREATMLQLHQTPSSTGAPGVIDDPALLEGLKVPGWQQITQRQIENVQANAEAATAAAEEEHERAVELELIRQLGDREQAKIKAKEKNYARSNSTSKRS